MDKYNGKYFSPELTFPKEKYKAKNILNIYLSYSLILS